MYDIRTLQSRNSRTSYGLPLLRKVKNQGKTQAKRNNKKAKRYGNSRLKIQSSSQQRSL